MASRDTSVFVCTNCNAVVKGNYCNQCGQKKFNNQALSVPSFLKETFHIFTLVRIAAKILWSKFFETGSSSNILWRYYLSSLLSTTFQSVEFMILKNGWRLPLSAIMIWLDSAFNGWLIFRLVAWWNFR
jgi:hypothetical protein